jgi:hypothetical protein
MADIFVGSVAVGVVPDARGWEQKMRDQLLPPSKRVGDEVGKEVGKGVESGMKDAGDKSAKDFGTVFKERMKEILDTLPPAKIDGDATPVDRKLEQLRAKLAELSHTDIIDSKKADVQIMLVERNVKALARMSKDISLGFDTKGALGKLAEIRALESRALGLGPGGGAPGRKGPTVASVEALVGTGAGAVGAGGTVLGNIMAFFGGIKGFFGGGGGGGGAAAAAAAGAPAEGAPAEGAPAAGGGMAAFGGIAPYAIAAGAVAAPFIAQAIAGAVVAGFGAALVGVGVMGAAMSGKLTKPFKIFSDDAKREIISIGASFVPVIQSLLRIASQVMRVMAPIFKLAVATIAGPIQVFAGTLMRAFAQPAVQKSILAIANAFKVLMQAITPDVAGGVKSLAEAITRVANAFASNPKAFADLINFMFQIVIFVVNAIAWLTKLAVWLEKNWKWAIWFLPGIAILVTIIRAIVKFHHDIAHWFDLIRHDIAASWDWTWSHTIGAVVRMLNHFQYLMEEWRHNIAHWLDNVKLAFQTGWDWVYSHTIGAVIRLVAHAKTIFDGWWQNIQNWFTNVKNAFTTAWDTIYNNTIGAIIRLIGKAESLFIGWKNNIIGWGKDALTWLVKTGSDLIAGFRNGIVGAMKDVAKWGYNDIVKPVINFLLSPTGFSIHSPSRKMIPIGRQIITGIIHGMLGEGKNIGHFVAKVFGSWPHAISSYLSKGLINMGQILKLPTKAISLLGNVLGFSGGGIAAGISGFFHRILGGGGGNVAKWAGTVSKALTMLGLPQSLSGAVLYQMQTESGGDPNAQNNWDINAKRGDPSRGLMQVIGGTFSQYHVPGTSYNIFDPLANIASALNYARHVYGPNLRSGRGGIGSGHGYDVGGWLPPGVTLAYNLTGQKERILSPTEYKSYQAGGTQFHAHFDGLTLATIDSQVRTAFHMMNLQQGNMQRQGRRS